MTQVAKAMERLEPWLPLRESAPFSGAFDAVYSGAHADIVTLWQDAAFREKQFDEQKKSLDEEWGAQPESSPANYWRKRAQEAETAERRFFDPLQERVRELETEKSQLEAALAREERKTEALSEKVDEWFGSAKHWRDKAEQAQQDRNEAQMERSDALAELAAAEKWPKTTPTGHTYVEPRTYEALCHEHDNAAQARIESWDADECPPEPTWEMVGIAHREVERLQRELRDLKQTAYEFVPHFKLHRDGSITPQQDDTPVWTMGTMHEDVPVALIVTEDAVEEVEVTQEAASWRAGGTGVPTFWNLDKLREMRDGALTEWIEVEAIIREAEKREKEEAPIRDKVRELQDVLYSDRNDISDDEARRVEKLARYLVEKEQS